MARLDADENFPRAAVVALRSGHDVLTCDEAGQAGRGIPDEQVLAFADADRRAVLTLNRKDFRKLHDAGHPHSGILLFTEDRGPAALAGRIDRAIAEAGELAGTRIRIVRPAN